LWITAERVDSGLNRGPIDLRESAVPLVLEWLLLTSLDTAVNLMGEIGANFGETNISA